MADVRILGSINQDIVATVNTLPGPGETAPALAVTAFCGGKGANQAIAAARAGASVAMVGRVGDDPAGAQLRQALVKADVSIEDVGVDAHLTTGQAFINVAANAENQIVVHAGANAGVGVEDARKADDAKVRLAQLESPLAAVHAFFSSSPSGVIRMLNAAPALAPAVDIFPDTDILIVNETEFAAFTDQLSAPDNDRDIAAAAAKLALRPDQVLILTRGKRGGLVLRDGVASPFAAFIVEAVDTTGAGDCFCGVLAARLSQDAPLMEAVRFAAAASALAVTRPGAAEAAPTASQIEALLDQT